MTGERMPIGVFVAPRQDVETSLANVRELGLRTVQLLTPRADQRSAARADQIRSMCADAGVAISLVFCGFPGESYATIEAVREQVGLVPAATRAERVGIAREIAGFAAALGAPGIGIHIGFVSEEHDAPEFAAVAEAAGRLADHCASLGLSMNLETGQETAETLLHLLRTVDRPNLFVNFDPANMILYGSGEPLEALRKVGRYVRSCHCKDATWSDRPGEEWGEEVPLGQGAVDIRRFVATLNEIGYDGPLTIEREVAAGRQRNADVRAGIELLRQIKADLGIA